MSICVALRVRAVLVAVALAALVPACSRPAEDSSESAGRPVKVAVFPYLGYSPFFIGQEEGYFREQGIEVEFVSGDYSLTMLPVFIRGELDVFPSTISAGMLNAIARGAMIRIVADKGQIRRSGDTYISLMARRELVESGKLTDPRQLKGRRISISRSSTLDYFLAAVLSRGGLSRDDVEAIHLPVVTTQEAMAKGSLDLVVMGEPWKTRILRSGAGVVWMPASEVIPGHQFAMVAYGPYLLETNRDAGLRFLAGYLAAVRQYNEGKTDRNLEIVARQTGLDTELLREATWPWISGDGRINVQDVLEFQEWTVEQGFQDRILAEHEFWDPTFLDRLGQAGLDQRG